MSTQPFVLSTNLTSFVSSELSESAFCPIVQVINDDVEQYWPQYMTRNFALMGLGATVQNLLGPVVQFPVHLLTYLPNLPMLPQLVNKDIMEDRVKCLTKVKHTISTALQTSIKLVILL